MTIATPSVIRPVTAADAAGVRELYEGLSPGDRRLRFLQSVAVYPERVLRFLTTVDDRRHLAMGAFEGWRCTGVAQGVRHHGRPDSAELAFTVAADRRGFGLGRRLVDRLLPRLEAVGIDRLDVTIDPVNHAAAGLARSIGFDLALVDDEVVGTLELDGGPGVTDHPSRLRRHSSSSAYASVSS